METAAETKKSQYEATVRAIEAEASLRKEVSVGLVQAIGGWPIFWAFIFPIGVYFNKVIIWDKVLMLGVTDPITGPVGIWVGIIISAIFGHSLGMQLISRWFK